MIVGEESQANSSSLTKHKWNIEIILSVLFFDTAGAKKRTKRNAENVSRLRARLGALPQVPATFFEKRSIKNFQSWYHNLLRDLLTFPFYSCYNK